MKFTCEKSTLMNALHKVVNIIGPKTTLPILSNILLEVQNNTLILISTDLEVGIKTHIPVEVSQDGGITIPAKNFTDIIKELPEATVTISVKKNNSIAIECEKSFFKLMGLPKEEFPALPDIPNNESILMDQGLLKQLFLMTSFAVSREETRYVLNGVLFVLDNNKIKLIATDGRRLALIERNIDTPNHIKKQVIIPTKSIAELIRALEPQSEVRIIFGDNQIIFALGDTTIISRLIEGEFPNYSQVIPPPHKDKIKINTNNLLLAAKRVALLASQDSPSIKIDLLKDKMVISKERPEIGEAREELDISYSGAEFSIGFNPQYLIEPLKCINQLDIDLELTDPEKAGVIRASEDNYTYILLPMKLA